MTDHEATARRLLPCSSLLPGCSTASAIDHHPACDYWKWPKIAAALAEVQQTAWQAGSDAGHDARYPALEAEIADLRAQLAERDNHYLIIIGDYEMWREKHLAEIADLRAQLAEAEKDLELQKKAYRMLWEEKMLAQAERDEARAEPERLYHEYEQHLQVLNAENESLKAKLAEAEKRHDDLWEMDRKVIGELKADHDAEFVRGLERAKEIAAICSGTAATAADWIAAEIAEAGKEPPTVTLEQFAKDYPCHCAENYPGLTPYHGQDCQNDVVQEFVAQWQSKVGK